MAEHATEPAVEGPRVQDRTIMVAILLGIGTVLVLWAWLGDERIPANEGTGFDGQTYAMIVRDPGVILSNDLSVHRIQRILPPLLAFAVLRPLGLNTHTPAIVGTFQVLNYLVLAAGALLWWQISKRLGLSRPAAWVGYAALFLNYPSLKLSSFYPILTDRFGFLLGLLLVWMLVLNKTRLLLALAVVASFTWPTVTYSAIVAFVMGKRPAALRPRPVWGLIAALGAAGLVVVGALRAHSCGVPCVSGMMVQTTVEWLFPLSLVLVAVWVCLALQPVAARLTPRLALASIVWWRIPVALGLLYAISWVHHALASPNDFTISRTLSNTALGSVVKPLGFLVVHATYYGPGVLLLILAWRIAVRRMARFGPPMLALLIIYLLLGVSTESRILINQWPFFALAAALVADELRWSMRKAWIFGALALVMSRIWLPIHHGSITADWQTYPSQWYFMSNGPATTPLSYVLLTVLALTGGAVVWHLVKEARPVERAGAAPSADALYRD